MRHSNDNKSVPLASYWGEWAIPPSDKARITYLDERRVMFIMDVG